MMPTRNKKSATSQGYQPLRGENEASGSLFPSLGRRMSPERAERPAERPLDRNQRIQPLTTVNKTIAPGQVSGIRGVVYFLELYARIGVPVEPVDRLLTPIGLNANNSGLCACSRLLEGGLKQNLSHYQSLTKMTQQRKGPCSRALPTYPTAFWRCVIFGMSYIISIVDQPVRCFDLRHLIFHLFMQNCSVDRHADRVSFRGHQSAAF